MCLLTPLNYFYILNLTIFHVAFPAVKVVVDRVLDTCVAGGVEILGLHATVAPRRQQQQAAPTLEEFRFVPYVQPLDANKSNSLTRYAESTLALIKTSLGNMMKAANGTMPNGKLFREVVAALQVSSGTDDIARYEASPQCGLIQTLRQLVDLENDSNFTENVASVLDASKDDLLHDRLMSHLTSGETLKIFGDVVLENVDGNRLKVVEVGASQSQLFSHIIPNLNSQPTVNVDYTVVDPQPGQISEDMLDNMDMKSATWDMTTDAPGQLASADLLVAANILHLQQDLPVTLSKLSSLLKEGGFLLIQEPTRNFAISLCLEGLNQDLSTFTGRTVGPFCDENTWERIIKDNGLQVVGKKSDGLVSTMYLCRKMPTRTTEPQIIAVDDSCFSWVEDVKKSLQDVQEKSAEHTVWLVANGPCNGIVGLANCLRQEAGGDHLRCLYVNSKERQGVPDVSASSTIFKELLRQDLVMNVYHEGMWGSFRHLPSQARVLVDTPHAYVNVLTRGDLASLRWIESPLKHFIPEDHPEKELCAVSYTSLNFRDIMLATGKLPPDAIPGDMATQDCILGMEFSGYDSKGKRVMGLLPAKGLATTVDADSRFLWDVPESWTLQEAASVPVVYATVYYALVVRGRIRKGDRVLIHSGSGGVGQAAIAVALHHGCEVFTTVGSQAKREYLMERFPQLKPQHFSNSRDTTFEWDILRATRGKGVDVVLNSLAEEKLQSSLRILAAHGRFLEIGKFDLANNTALGKYL